MSDVLNWRQFGEYKPRGLEPQVYASIAQAAGGYRNAHHAATGEMPENTKEMGPNRTLWAARTLGMTNLN